MTWETEDAEAAWAEHIAECPVCARAVANDEPQFGPGCSEYEGEALNEERRETG